MPAEPHACSGFKYGDWRGALSRAGREPTGPRHPKTTVVCLFEQLDPITPRQLLFAR